MNQTPKFIELTHANTKATIVVVASQVFSFYFSEGHKCTLVLSAGGALLPVKESSEEIRKLLSL